MLARLPRRLALVTSLSVACATATASSGCFFRGGGGLFFAVASTALITAAVVSATAPPRRASSTSPSRGPGSRGSRATGPWRKVSGSGSTGAGSSSGRAMPGPPRTGRKRRTGRGGSYLGDGSSRDRLFPLRRRLRNRNRCRPRRNRARGVFRATDPKCYCERLGTPGPRTTTVTEASRRPSSHASNRQGPSSSSFQATVASPGSAVTRTVRLCATRPSSP